MELPETVSLFLESMDLEKVRTCQNQLLDGYQKYIQKYAPLEQRILISESYRRIPVERNRKDKHFRKSKFDYPNAKNLDLRDAFFWLTNADVALASYNVYESTYPLRLNEDRKTVKLFSNDIGLLSCQLFDRENAVKVMQGDCTINFGAPFENVVAEELASKGYPLYYYNHKKCGEIDFLIQKKGQIIPLEVKSGNPNATGKYEHHALIIFSK